jgi:hypothetical protein
MMKIWRWRYDMEIRNAVEIESFIFKITKEIADEILAMDKDNPQPRIGLICELGASIPDTADIIVEFGRDGSCYVASKNMLVRGPDNVFCYLKHDVNDSLCSDDLPRLSDIFKMR